MKRSKAEIESEKFWSDVYREGAKQRRIQQREQREKAKSSGGRRGGRSRGYFSSVGKSGRKSQGAGRTTRISSSSYCHKTSVVVKKIHPNLSRYNNAKTITNALNYIAGLSETSEQKNENVKMIFFNGNDNFPFKVQENQNQMYVDLFKENLELENGKPLSDEDTALLEKTPPLVQHIIFSIDCNTTKNSEKIEREEIANIEEQALIKLAQENEILQNHMILLAMHDNQKAEKEEHTNGIHFHIIKSNFNTDTMELERDFWSKEQIRNLQREFAINCQNLGLDIKIPREYKQKNIEIQEEISEKQRQTENLSKCPHKVLSIEFYKNNKAKSIVFQNLENGEIFQRNDRDIGRFVSENNIRVDDEFKVDLRIIKETNKKGKEYTTYQWQTPLNRTNEREKQEQKEARKKQIRQEKEEKVYKNIENTFESLKNIIEYTTSKENDYKRKTNQTYKESRSIAVQIYQEKISKIPKTETEQREEIKKWNDEKLDNFIEIIKTNPHFYLNITKEEKEKIQIQEKEWEQEIQNSYTKGYTQEEIQEIRARNIAEGKIRAERERQEQAEILGQNSTKRTNQKERRNQKANRAKTNRKTKTRTKTKANRRTKKRI